MTNRTFILFAALLAGVSAARAEVVFEDNFDQHPDGDTASVYQGGTPNDPSLGDADPLATIGTWFPIYEPQPWYVQVSTATNGPTAGNLPGPAGGTGKYLVVERQNELTPTSPRGQFTTPATGQLSIDFDLGMVGGMVQFFVRDRTAGSFEGLPFYVNFDPEFGAVIANGVTTSLTFDPFNPRYTSVNLLVDVPAQSFSLTVNGTSAADATNLPFIEPVTQIQEIAFYVVDFGLFGVDNVLAETIGDPENNADFDGDGDVDGADFLTWQRGVGTAGGQPEGNADGLGGIDGDDLAVWKTQFGQPQSQVASLAIPEPGCVVLLGLGAAALAVLSSRSRQL